VFVGFAIDLDLSHNNRDVWCVGDQEVDSRQTFVFAAPCGFSIEAQLLAQFGAPSEDPSGQSSFKGSDVESSEDIGKGSFTRTFGGVKTESVGEWGPMVACKLGDGFE